MDGIANFFNPVFSNPFSVFLYFFCALCETFAPSAFKNSPHSPLYSFDKKNVMTQELPLFEVFLRSKQGLEHKHCGSLHAADAQQALNMARDVYTRRMEGVSIWVVASKDITASQPEDKDEMFEPASDKIYRHPTFYDIPDTVGHM
jgi:ring-1,2-phenylacetyl-CoA epoxidase subunit PaaB